MKNDKFLLGIVVGIVLLIVVATVVVLARGPQEEYIADNTPAGVVHNYFLAIQRRDYDKAYGYISDEIEAKPDLDEFIRTVDYSAGQSETSIQIGESTVNADRAQVEIGITTYRGGSLFDSGSYTDHETAYLRPWVMTNGD